MKVLFCGGGTAGHVNPAVAIADALIERDKNAEVAFVGRIGGEEYTLVNKRNYKLYRIKTEGLAGKNILKAVKTFAVGLRSLKEARRVIKDFKPDVIVGTGGYVSAPVVFCGHLMKIPTLIHESNAYPGLTTRMLSGMVDKLLLNFDSCKDYLKKCKSIRVVGNPLVNDFSTVTKEVARKRLGIGKRDFLIISFGGSGGAMALNSIIIELMKSYSIKTPSLRHFHAVGRKYYPEIKAKEGALCRGARGCKILPYIDDMPTFMNAADLVISRSGAMTLSEISAVGVPSILIPSPNVADDHQAKNARRLSEIGAARYIEENELTLRALLDTVCEIQQNPELRKKMSKAAGEQYRDKAKSDIIDEIYSLMQ